LLAEQAGDEDADADAGKGRDHPDHNEPDCRRNG
jgi:hypothetical protein